jgi:hypothetical protein
VKEKRGYNRPLETFGIEPMPDILVEADKEIKVRLFLEIKHQIGCPCGDCLKLVRAKARMIAFGRKPEDVTTILHLAKIEKQVDIFKKDIDKISKYL